MKKNLEILEIEPKLTRDGKEQKYWRFKTNEGWMSCFDETASKQLRAFIGKVACVDVIDSGDFKNIRKCYGAMMDEELIPNPDEKPEVVRPGEVVKGATSNSHTTMYVSYAKDIFCAMLEKGNKADMDDAIELVKQAKEAFE